MTEDRELNACKVARGFWSRDMKSFGEMHILLQVDLCQQYGACIEHDSDEYYKAHVEQWDQEMKDYFNSLNT